MRAPRRPAIIDDDVAKIALGKDAKHGYAIVDKDFAWLDQYFWTIHKGKYAATKPSTKAILMHRMIVIPTEGMTIDHINGDKLDNRRANLRVCTLAQNNLNKPKQSNSKHAYKGIEFRAKVNKYIARIKFNGKCYNLGHYITPEEAAIAYNNKAKELHGEFAYLNEVKQS